MVSHRNVMLAAVLFLGCSDPVTAEPDGGASDASARDGGPEDGGPAEDGGPGDDDGGLREDGGSVDGGSANPCEPGYGGLGGCAPLRYLVPGNRDGAEACEIWERTRRETATGLGWDGTADTCDPGVLVDAARDDALRRVNGHRELLWLSPYELYDPADGTGWERAQDCALVVGNTMATQRSYSNVCGVLASSPPHEFVEWEYLYSASNERPADSVTEHLLTTDWGNSDTNVVGSSLFSPPSERLLLGFSHGGFCASARDFRTDPGSRILWFASPPPGAYPFDLYPDEWVVFVKDHDIRGATPSVTITGAGGVNIAVTDVEELGGIGYTGIRFRPASLPDPNETYTVEVGPLEAQSDADMDFSPTLTYETTRIRCL